MILMLKKFYMRL